MVPIRVPVLHKQSIEMRAVKLALSHFDIPATLQVLVVSDSSTVVAYKTNVVCGTSEVDQGKTQASPPVGENAQTT